MLGLQLELVLAEISTSIDDNDATTLSSITPTIMGLIVALSITDKQCNKE